MKILACLLASTIALASATPSMAAQDDAKARYKRVLDAADSAYTDAKAKCDALRDHEQNVCAAEAKSTRNKAKASAEAEYKKTPEAEANARLAAADSDYAVAKAKCDGRQSDDRDACRKEAKALHVSAVAAARADRKVAEGRRSAAQDKPDAMRDAAKERCDALSGADKDKCIAAVKGRNSN